MPQFKDMPMHPDQMLMFPQSVEDTLPGDGDVRAFGEVMDYLDYSKLESKCSHTGCPPYPPKVMTKIIGYAYSKGIRSSRKIESLLRYDMRFIWLGGGLLPDHNTIARFRKEHWDELNELFKGSVKLCAEAGLVFLNVVSTDGSKIRACASAKKIYNQSRVDREMAAVEKVLKEAEEVDRKEDEQYGQENEGKIPEHLKDAKKRKEVLEEIAKRLKESKSNNVVSSEMDSRVMKCKEGKVPCYNLQASVDSENQVIVAMELVQSETDHGHLPEMINQVEENTGLSPDVALADCGYNDEETLSWGLNAKNNVLVPLQEHKDAERKDLFCKRCFIRDEERDVLICPAGRDLSFRRITEQRGGTYRVYEATGCQSCSFQMECVGNTKYSKQIKLNVREDDRERMRKKLKASENKQLYALRKETVEPVFGQIKRDMGFDRLLLKGFNGAVAEVALICLVHNMLKCVRNAAARAYLAFIKQKRLISASFIVAIHLMLMCLHRLWWHYIINRSINSGFRCIAG